MVLLKIVQEAAQSIEINRFLIKMILIKRESITSTPAKSVKDVLNRVVCFVVAGVLFYRVVTSEFLIFHESTTWWLCCFWHFEILFWRSDLLNVVGWLNDGHWEVYKPHSINNYMNKLFKKTSYSGNAHNLFSCPIPSKKL